MKETYITKTPGAPCCCCGEILDMAGTDEGPYRPTPGDYTVCLYCATVLVFTETLALRKATDADWREMPEETQAGLRDAVQFVLTSIPPQDTKH